MQLSAVMVIAIYAAKMIIEESTGWPKKIGVIF